MRKISVRLTEPHYEMLEMLVASGEYASTSEALRDAIRRMITEKKDLIEKAQVRSQYK
ncbi:MAG: ribbon-helix-helix domain-containing protein [Halobacteriota archaeon]